VLVGGLITAGVAVGVLGCSQLRADGTPRCGTALSGVRTDLSKAAVDQHTNTKMLFIAFGEMTNTCKLTTDLCTSFATLKGTGPRAAVCGAIAAGVAFGAGAVVATTQDKEWCTIMYKAHFVSQPTSFVAVRLEINFDRIPGYSKHGSLGSSPGFWYS
jgi:hypothetical protein